MGFPATRLRRLRQSPQIRALVRETTLRAEDLMAPLFVVPGEKIKSPISSLPGQFRFSVDMAAEQAAKLGELGIQALLLFGIPAVKDERGDTACDEFGLVQEAIRKIKSTAPAMLVAADLCFCEYTSHGHCGIIVDGKVHNDLTLIQTKKQAVSLAHAGADIIAPSGMMDGMVAAIREALEEKNLPQTVIMSYSAKYASAYYGPFREAVNSSPAFGDRKNYQMDPANSDEALREVALDLEEGADIVMVKPALAYLDIIRRVKDSFPVPLAAYNVSGEYAMIKNAAAHRLIDGEQVMLETLQAIKRAGADLIITYFAEEAAPLVR